MAESMRSSDNNSNNHKTAKVKEGATTSSQQMATNAGAEAATNSSEQQQQQQPQKQQQQQKQPQKPTGADDATETSGSVGAGDSVGGSVPRRQTRLLKYGVGPTRPATYQVVTETTSEMTCHATAPPASHKPTDVKSVTNTILTQAKAIPAVPIAKIRKYATTKSLTREPKDSDDPLISSRSAIVAPSQKCIPPSITRNQSKSQLEIITSKLSLPQNNNNNNNNQPKRATSSNTVLERFKGNTTSNTTTTIAASHPHPPGHMPSYLTKPSNISLNSSLHEKFRKFVTAKKQAAATQESLQKQFIELIDMNTRVTKMGGKPMKIEKLQLIVLTPNEDGSVATTTCSAGDTFEQLGDKTTNKEVLQSDKCLSGEPSSNKNNHSSIDSIEEQLRKLQNEHFDWYSKMMESLGNFSNMISAAPNIDEFPQVLTSLKQAFDENKKSIEQLLSENSKCFKDMLIKIDLIKQSTTSVTEEMDNKEVQISTLQSKLHQLENQIQSMKQEDVVSLKDAEITILKSQLDDQKIALQNIINKDLVLKDKEISRLQSQLNEIQKSPPSSKNHEELIHRKNQEIAQLTDQLTSLQNNQNSKEHKTNRLKDDEISRLQSLLNDKQTAVDSIEKKKNQETRELRAQIADLQAELKSKLIESNQMKIVQDNFENQQSILRNLTAELEAKNADCKTLWEEYQRYREQAEQNESKSMDNEQTIYRLKQTIEQLNENFSALKDDFAKHKLEAIEKVKQLGKEVADREKSINSQSKHTLELENKLSATLLKYDELCEKFTRIQSDKSKLLAELQCKEKEFDALKPETETIRADKQKNTTGMLTSFSGGDCDSPLNLKEQIAALENDKQSLQDELAQSTDSLDSLRQQLESAVTQLKNLEIAHNRQQKQLKHKVCIIQKLEMALDSDYHKVNETKAELESMKKLCDEKNVEVEELRVKVDEAREQCSQYEETIAMHQRILRIRSQLILAMRRKGESNRCRMVDLYSEIGKKSSIVSKMDYEISARAEEMQNMFSTLSTKQMEVSRQDQLIKMLEECNAHNLRIRTKQFDRLTKLEKQNSELRKQLLLSGASDIAGDCPPLTPRSTDTSFNRYMFREERRKKRREMCMISKAKSGTHLSGNELDALP